MRVRGFVSIATVAWLGVLAGCAASGPGRQDGTGLSSLDLSSAHALPDERGAWRDAVKQDTLTGYKAFAQEYPDGRFASAAEKLIAAREWREALTSGSLDKYVCYLWRHPEGKHTQEARRLARHRIKQAGGVRLPAESSLVEEAVAAESSAGGAKTATEAAAELSGRQAARPYQVLGRRIVKRGGSSRWRQTVTLVRLDDTWYRLPGVVR